jgi:hypothetical protein
MTSIQDPALLCDTQLDDVRDILIQMRRLESTTYKRPMEIPEPFNGLWRQQIVEWMYTLVNFCELRHESAAAGTFFLDVAVSKGLIKTANDYQLGAMTALYLGLKIFDSPTMRVVKLGSLVKLGSGDFGENDVIQMELQMLQILQWRMNPPTPNCFLQQYMLLFPKDTLPETLCKIEKLSLQAIEVCVSRDPFLTMKPSVLAYAAILKGFDQMDQSDMSIWQLRTFLYSMTDVAKLDHTSLSVTRAATLLDRSLRSLPIPSERKLASGDASDPKGIQYEQTVVADGFSPTYVAMPL